MAEQPKVDFKDEIELANNSGLIHREFMDKVLRFLKSGMEDRAAQRDAALEKLVSEKLLGDAEAKDLRDLCEGLRRSDQNRSERSAGARSLDEKFRKNNSSNHARIVAGIAVDSVDHEIDSPTAGRVAHADVEGAIVGGIFGLELGGGYGAAGGMILGGLASSVAEAY